MFCFKCGHEISNDALFCSHCGTAQNQNRMSEVAKCSENSTDYSREALKIYFADLLTLECINKKLHDCVCSLKLDVETKENNNYWKRYCFYQIGKISRYLYLRYDGSEIKFAAIKAYRGESSIYKVDNRGYIIYDWDIYNDGFPTDVAAWFSVEKSRELFESVWLELRYTLFGEKFVVNKQRKEACLNFYYDFKKTAPTEYQKNANEISRLKHEYDEIKKEFEKASELLEQAYDVNIVPKQFRNLYAIYYLSDFINSSNESLSTALLNYNLETIKEKLDKIIEQQQEIIINQALTIAQNEKIMKQNENQLRHLASIEQNTDRAAQYAQIASNNAEACAWIGIANYISK